MLNLEQAAQLAQKTLTAKRFNHSLCVASQAGQLAAVHGASEEKAQLAGLLHDIMKETPRDEMLALLMDNKPLRRWLLQYPAAVWHGPVAAHVLAKTHRLQDKQVLSAIFCHTFGKANMQKLDKIVYIADLVGQDRSYPNVQKLRALAFAGLNNALLAIMKEQVQVLQGSGKKPLPQTIAAIKNLEGSGRVK